MALLVLNTKIHLNLLNCSFLLGKLFKNVLAFITNMIVNTSVNILITTFGIIAYSVYSLKWNS